MENPEIPGRIQMAPFIPVEIFRQKSNTFRGIIFFPFLPKRRKFSVSFVWITSARLHVEREWKMRRYFVIGTTQSRSCFRCQKNTSIIWRESLTEISVQMVSAHNHAFSRSIYRKKTSTGLYTKWDSFTTQKYKINLIRTLTFRCYSPITLSFELFFGWTEGPVITKTVIFGPAMCWITTYGISDVLNRQRNRPK